MKVYEIQGELIDHDDQTHQEMIQKLTELLLNNGFFLKCTTKEHKDN